MKKGERKALPELPRLREANILAIDLETKDDGIKQDLGPGGVRGLGHVLGIAVATEKQEWYLPIRHVDSENYSVAAIQRWCKDNLCRKGQLKVGANILYDLEWMRAEGFQVLGPFADVQHAEPLLDENKFTYSLESLAEKYLPKGQGKLKHSLEEQAREYLGPEVKFKDPREILYLLPSRIVAPYAERDARATYDVYKKQLPLISEEELDTVFSYECRLIPLLLEMRFRGVRISIPKMNKANSRLEEEIQKNWKILNKIAGANKISSVNNTEELARLWDAAGLPYARTPKTGRPSFTKQSLAATNHPVAEAVRKLRKLEKMHGTFIDGSLKKFMVKDRLFACANQLRSDEYGTVSGRFSYSRPNLQQVPAGEEEFAGELIRSLFIPDVGELWAKIDWSQIEYRIMAHFAKKLNLPKVDRLIDAYKQDRSTDVHQWLADMIHRPRRFSKGINFGVAYCMGLPALCASLGLSKVEGDLIMQDYRAEMPWMLMLQKQASAKASRTGFIRTILGRRRRFNLYEPRGVYGKEREKALPKHEAIEKWGQNIARAACYKALNALIQGSAADLMKVAMVDSFESGVFDVIGIPGIVVHDEMDISIPNTKTARAGYAELQRIMETCIPLEVPIVADATIGKSWWDQKPFVFKGGK